MPLNPANDHARFLSRPFAGLIFVSIGCGILWRFEVETVGWSGLIWLTYEHLAPLVGVVMFIIWQWLITAEQATSARVYLAVATALWLLVGGQALKLCLGGYFGGGFTIFDAWHAGLERFLVNNFKWFTPALWVLFPAITFLIWKPVLNLRLTASTVGVVVWALSWHLGLTVISILPERGSADLIHSLKTGWMIPFAVFGLGFPLLFTETTRLARGTATCSNDAKP